MLSITTPSKSTEMPPSHFFASFSTPSHTIRPSFSILFLKPFSTTTARAAKKPFPDHSHPSLSSPNLHSSSWLNEWPSPPPPPSPSLNHPKAVNNYAPETSKAATTSAIDRIVLRLRNLGLGSDDEDEDEDEDEDPTQESKAFHHNSGMPTVTGEEKLGDLLKREWVRPDTMLVEEREDGQDAILPWEREEREELEVVVEEMGVKKRTVKAPTLAELTIEDGELRRLRRQGMTLRERINVPKAGVTNSVLEKIHEKWRKNELLRLKFHEVLARDMKTAHEIVEVGMLEYICFLSY